MEFLLLFLKTLRGKLRLQEGLDAPVELVYELPDLREGLLGLPGVNQWQNRFWQAFNRLKLARVVLRQELGLLFLLERLE